jgi:general secretion pathway protein H
MSTTDPLPVDAPCARVARARPAASNRQRGRCTRGFTLVEVLVVLTIIALLASLIAVNLAPDARQALREEGVRLAALLAHARDEAITTGAPIAWQRTDVGYRFLTRASDRTWRPVDGDASLRARVLPNGISLAGVEMATAAAPGKDPLIILSPTGVADRFRITLAFGEHRVDIASDGVGAPIVADAVR